LDFGFWNQIKLRSQRSFPEDVQYNGQQYTQDNTGHNGKIEFKVFPLVFYVTWQPEKRQNIGEQSQNNQDYSRYN